MKKKAEKSLISALKYIFLTASGGALYYGIETVFRIYRHHRPPLPHVFFLGGFAFLICLLLCRIPLRGVKRYVIIPALGGVALTVYEYFFGLYFLVTRDLRIWDYTGCAFEYRGLICLQFSFCWVGAALLVVVVYDIVLRRYGAKSVSRTASVN